MADLFGDYELLATSGLFDAEYYVEANPDIATLNLDPLMHYLEKGGSELRNPSKAFDARFYVQLCQQRGQRVENPLLHYIRFGAALGLTPRPNDAPVVHTMTDKDGRPAILESEASDLLVHIDRIVVESDGEAARVSGVGWCLSANPIVELKIELGGRGARARYGLPRADVAHNYPQYLKADHSGFEFTLTSIPEPQAGVVDFLFTAKTSLGTIKASVPIDVDANRTPPEPKDATLAPSGDRTGIGRPSMQLCIDSAEVDKAGILHVAGWALCLAPISSVQIFIDEMRLAAAEYGRPREDVALSHPEYPNARNSGFALHADISSHGVGDHWVKVQAIASTGISRETTLPLSLSNKASEPMAQLDDTKLHYFCDLIEITTGGRFIVKGWAVGVTPTERIAVFLNGEEIGFTDIGIERPDVGNLFPGLAHARMSGFSFRHTLPPVKEAEHLVILRHRAADKEQEILLPVQAVPGYVNDGEVTSTRPASNDLLLRIDVPKMVGATVVAPIRGTLEVIGWALARRGIASIDILIDGERIKSATTGMRRTDVQQAFPDWADALTAGFSALLPHRTLPKGQHTVSIALRDREGQVAHSEFRIVVEEVPDTDGPWSLRRRMTPAETNLMSRPLLGMSDRPSFELVMTPMRNSKDLERARLTLASLEAQVYRNWRLHVLTLTSGSKVVRRALLDGFEQLGGRVEVISSERAISRLFTAKTAASHLMIIRPGDLLGCDALLEFAVSAALHPAADLFYCDERRVSPSSGNVEAFFKPQWSPDLLLSMNYLGRAWCARAHLFAHAAIRARQLADAGSYDLALRVTEQAAGIQHVAATLVQVTGAFEESDASARKALRAAVTRRGIRGSVKPGRIKGTFRVRRDVDNNGLVSIIIPTCAARGLIRTCIETIRNLTSYRNYEIVCIENIPPDRKEWKEWLRAQSDRVIETAEPFNWSRFNNLAVAESRGEFLLFLNDDIEIIDSSWLDVLLEHAQRPEVGVVGPQLLYPDRRIQHAGMFLAGLGVARHAFRYAGEDDPGYFGLALTQRNVIAVTGACLMTRRETFKALGCFNEIHDIVNNDIDYCLRVWQRRQFTIYTPHTTLVHHELGSRSEIADSYDTTAFKNKWRSVFMAGDPFFHPRLTKDRDDYSFEWEPPQVHAAGHPVLDRATIRRILILKLDHIGDCVTALPAIRRLKRHFPAATLSVLTGSASKAIWALEPVVDDLIEFDFFHARSALGKVDKAEGEWRKLRDRLMPRRFDLAIDLRKHWETRPVLQYTGARYLAGFDMKGKFPWLDVAIEVFEDSPLLHKRQHVTDDLVNLVDAVAAASETDRASFVKKPAALAHHVLAGVPRGRQIFSKRVVCVHPAVGTEMRQWPPEYFAMLIDQIIETENVHVILIGGPDEAELGATVLDGIVNSHSVWSMIGRIKLSDLPALIARCALFVGNNSGPQHIAAGLGVPTVGIHSGVVDAREWGPKGINAVAIQRAMTCSPCYHSKLEDCGRGLACLRALSPADVMRVCRRMIATSPPDTSDGRPRRLWDDHWTTVA